MTDRTQKADVTGRRRVSGTGWRAGWIAGLCLLACASPESRQPGPTELDAAAQGEFETLWMRYERRVSPKAFAFAYDGHDWVWGMAERAADRTRAREHALELCEAARSVEGVRASCSVYAVDGEVVWSLQDHLREFQAYPGHKVFWVAGPREEPLFDAVLGAVSRDEAVAQAMRDCEAEIAPYGLSHTCRVCQIDDGVPCTELEPGWGSE